jgi:uncharacterized protein (TIGR02466 family)
MAKVNIFQEFIITGILQDNELDKLIIETLEKHCLENKQRIVSNRGGFQTTNITNEIILKKLLIKTSNLLFENFNFSNNFKINIRNAWINKNNNNDYNIPHHHLTSDLSGVYYTKAFPGEGGDLVFYRDNSKLLDISKLSKILNYPEIHTTYTFTPQSNTIIIFPSYLSHSVEPSKTEGRISTAFNLNIIVE